MVNVILWDVKVYILQGSLKHNAHCEGNLDAALNANKCFKQIEFPSSLHMRPTNNVCPSNINNVLPSNI